ALSGFPVVTDHGKLVRRSHVPARRKIWSRPMRRDREHKLDLADIGGETDAATHDSDHSLARQTTPETGHDPKGVRTSLENKIGTLTMLGNPREIVTMAERRFPVRIRIGVPPSGFGQRYPEITEWLDGNCGADGWAITPSGMRRVLNDAVSIYF